MENKYFTFSEALELLKKGYKLSRANWGGKTQYIEIVRKTFYTNSSNEQIYSDCPVVAFHGTSGVQIGWLCSQADMLSDDWFIYDWKGVSNG